MRRSPARNLLLLLVVASLGLACDSSTSPIQDPLVFESEIGADGRNIHPVVLSDSGTVHVQFTRLDEKPVEGVEPADTEWVLGVGVGRPAEDQCSPTYSVSARVGDLVVLGLNQADYCFLVFDTGFLPDETIIEYTLTISPAS